MDAKKATRFIASGEESICKLGERYFEEHPSETYSFESLLIEELISFGSRKADLLLRNRDLKAGFRQHLLERFKTINPARAIELTKNAHPLVLKLLRKPRA